MSLPMLQVALDNQTMDSAYETTRLIAEEVDIIEVGTILCVGEGVRAVRDLKALYPHKIVLADAKIADAGKILSRMCFEANADWVTVICCADINTAKGALDVAKEFNGDVQIELTGYWTWEQAQQWRDAGIQQVVYHRTICSKLLLPLAQAFIAPVQPYQQIAAFHLVRVLTHYSCHPSLSFVSICSSVKLS